MERPCLVENGGIKVPIGYRFLPTDQELLIHYLQPKALSLPFPASVIPEFNVLHTHPCCIPGDLNEKRRYFFSNSRKIGALDSKCRRGYWKPIQKHKLIVSPHTNQPVGITKTLVFSQNKRLRGAKTRWFMHEFRLTQQTQDWAVYRLFQKKRKKKKKKKQLGAGVTSELKSLEEELRLRSNFIEFVVENEKGCEANPPQPSSCSSGVTDQEDSSNELALLGQEASSAYTDVFSSISFCMRKQE